MSSTSRIHNFFKSLPSKASNSSKDESLLRTVLIKQTMNIVLNIVMTSCDYQATELIKSKSNFKDRKSLNKDNFIKRKRLNSECDNKNKPIILRIKFN